jgi:IS1 family transposase
MRLGVRIGEGCARLLDRMMRNLACEQIQIDELWGFIGKKQRHVTESDSPELGDVWTFIGIDSDTKIVPAYRVGSRDAATAQAFVADLAGRMRNRVQLSSDSLPAYIDAVERAFGPDVDYGQIVKSFASTDPLPASSRYSPPPVVAVRRTPIVGNPEPKNISTSFIEKQNLTVRTHCRRLKRLTNAFSKKLANFRAAVSLHFGYYNLVKRHTTFRMTPAMAAGVVPSLWSVADLVREALGTE